MSQVDLATQVTALSIAVQSNFFYRVQPVDSTGGAGILKLIAEGKLTDEQVERSQEDGKDFIKRKPVAMQLFVPDMSKIVVDGTLSPAQITYLQQLVTTHIEQEQKKELDAVTGKVVDWSVIFSTEFAKKEAAVKVTAEERKAAAAALFTILATTCKPNVADVIKGLVEVGFTGNSLVRYMQKPEILLNIQTKLTDAVAALSEEDLGKHTNAINQCFTNLGKVLAPTDLDESDFA